MATKLERLAARFPREDGAPHSSPIATLVAQCRWCGLELPVRVEGRSREFCSPAHRVNWHKRSKRAATKLDEAPFAEELRRNLATLDAAGAPDREYRGLLSTSTKRPLRKGETWRARCYNVLARSGRRRLV